MARCTIFKLLLVGLLALWSMSATAQYYSWGADRAALKWSRLEGSRVSVIYPDSSEITAREILHYLDAIGSDSHYGFRYPALEVPFVVHPENFASNGMVMWMPIRIEFLSTPNIDGFAMPWVKQLVAHEYRHAVQYNNLDKSTMRWARYILGQQGAAASLLFPPLYMLEGDAVMAETQMSSFGRGLQPSFSMGYRALADDIFAKESLSKWYCGSYTGYVPNHYELGYQVASYAYAKYGENILDGAFAYTARNPQFISPYSVALRKYYDTSSRELFREAFAELIELWESLPEVNDSSIVISSVDSTNYTTYSHPMALEDGRVLSLKSDYQLPSRFVISQGDGREERLVSYTGVVSTRPTYAAGRVWWSEYRRSKLYSEDIRSQLCYMDVEQGRSHDLRGVDRALYPTPIGESATHIAYVEYLPSGRYSVVEMVDGCEVARNEVPYPLEVHSLAWDNGSGRLYIIVTGHEGMWIERQGDSGAFEPITAPSFATISSLRARDGVLYFGSIASGRDQVHSLDISSGRQSQLTEAQYGAFNPAVSREQLYFTRYDKYGYHLASQSIDDSVAAVEHSTLPRNIVNPERQRWDVINLDTVRFSMDDLRQAQAEAPAAKYRKGLNLVDIHSWAPISFDPYSLLSEMDISDISLGATLLSQNLLSSCDGYLSYGWNRSEGSFVRGGAQYIGMGVNLDVSATYGGSQRSYYIAPDWLGTYSDFSVSASLPLYFQRGYYTRYFAPSIGFNYSNGVVPTGLSYGYNAEYGKDVLTYSGIDEGLEKLYFGATYAVYSQTAYRDQATPKGYILNASYSANPTNSEYSQLVTLYGKLFTPGLFKNNSFTLEAAFQDSFGGFSIDGISLLGYSSSVLLPRGFTATEVGNNNYVALSANYLTPLCYPEFGVTRYLYFKRLSLGVGYDYAEYDYYNYGRTAINSYGGSLVVDLNCISMSDASTISLSMSLYKPKARSLYFQFGLSLPI